MQEEDQDIYEELLWFAVAELERGERVESIEQSLRLKCENIVLITVVLKEARNAHYAILRKQGFRLILTGCIIGILGFLITFLNFNTNRSIDLAMYGLTTTGLLVVFWGLFKILG